MNNGKCHWIGCSDFDENLRFKYSKVKYNHTWNPAGRGSCWTVNFISSQGRSNSITASWCVAPVTSLSFTFNMRSPILNFPHCAAIPSGTIYKIRFSSNLFHLKFLKFTHMWNENSWFTSTKWYTNGENFEFWLNFNFIFFTSLTKNGRFRQWLKILDRNILLVTDITEWNVQNQLPNGPWFLGKITSCMTKKRKDVNFKLAIEWDFTFARSLTKLFFEGIQRQKAHSDASTNSISIYTHNLLYCTLT